MNKENAPYTSFQIANEFIARGIQDNIQDMTNRKIQKLVYITHGFYLARNNKPLIEEHFIVGKRCPIIRRLYEKIRRIRIDNMIGMKQSFQTLLVENNKVLRVKQDDSNVLKVINTVWKSCKNRSSNTLSIFSNRSPWICVRYEQGNGAKLENEEIKHFFLRQLSTTNL